MQWDRPASKLGSAMLRIWPREKTAPARLWCRCFERGRGDSHGVLLGLRKRKQSAGALAVLQVAIAQRGNEHRLFETNAIRVCRQHDDEAPNESRGEQIPGIASITAMSFIATPIYRLCIAVSLRRGCGNTATAPPKTTSARIGGDRLRRIE